MTIRPTTALSDREWESAIGLWLDEPRQRLWRQHHDWVNRELLERWLPREPGRVLKTDLFEEALGKGLVPLLLERGAVPTGIDSSGAILDAVQRSHPGLDQVRADVRCLPFGDNEFDVVVSTSTLDHLPSRADIDAALCELRRVLRPGGVLILTLDNPRNPLVALLRALPRRRLNRLWFSHAKSAHRVGLTPYLLGATYGAAALRRRLPQLGFEPSEMTATLHSPRALAVVVGALLERSIGPANEARFLNLLAGFERLRSLPTRFLTGTFVAIRAVRR